MYDELIQVYFLDFANRRARLSFEAVIGHLINVRLAQPTGAWLDQSEHVSWI